MRYIKLRCTSGLADGFDGRGGCVEEGHFLLPVREEQSSSASQDATFRVRRSRALAGRRLGGRADLRGRPGW